MSSSSAAFEGLCLANGLHKAGIEVVVFERQATPSENLTGYGVHIDAHGRKALRNCLDTKEWERFEAVSTAAGTTMTFRDTALRILAERDDAMLSRRSVIDAERRGIGRLELRGILLKGLENANEPIVRWAKGYSRFETLLDGRVRAFFADGTTEDGDVLVGAADTRSKVRQQYLPHIRREDLGILAIAGRYILNKQRIRELPTAVTNGSLNNIVPDGKGWMFTSSWRSCSGGDGKQAEHYIVWAYVMAKGDTPTNIKNLSPMVLKDIAMAGTARWSPSLTTLVHEADPSTVGPVQLKCMPHLDAWAPSNVTLLGDAIQ